jgi:hypothetical protein
MPEITFKIFRFIEAGSEIAILSLRIKHHNTRVLSVALAG